MPGQKRPLELKSDREKREGEPSRKVRRREEERNTCPYIWAAISEDLLAQESVMDTDESRMSEDSSSRQQLCLVTSGSSSSMETESCTASPVRSLIDVFSKLIQTVLMNPDNSINMELHYIYQSIRSHLWSTNRLMRVELSPVRSIPSLEFETCQSVNSEVLSQIDTSSIPSTSNRFQPSYGEHSEIEEKQEDENIAETNRYMTLRRNVTWKRSMHKSKIPHGKCKQKVDDKESDESDDSQTS